MKLCEHDQCTGCGACAELCPVHCISMTPDRLGFLFPEADESRCVNCHLCEKKCPVLNPRQLKPVQKVYAAWANDERIRTTSSSGGVFSVFAEHILAQGGVINGVAFDRDLHLKHEIAERLGESARFRGSKYVQSWTNGIYQKIKENLEQGKKVLFTGVPCQVAGLKSYLGKDYEKLICCDIICHGVPSQKYLQYYLEKSCPIPFSEMASIQFRDLSGWGDFRLRVGIKDGRIWCASDKQNDYITAFLAGAMNNESCYQCPYACAKRIGDITLGDFWGLGTWKKFRNDTKQGCSVILVNTDKGEDFFQSIKSQLFIEERSFKEASRYNHQLKHPMLRPVQRDNFKGEWGHFQIVQSIPHTSSAKNILKKIFYLPFKVIQQIIRSANFTHWE